MGEGELWLREQVDGSAAGFDEDLAGAGAERDQVVAPLQIEVEGGRRAKIPAARKVVDKKWLRREVILARAVVAAGEVGLPSQEPAKQAPVLGRDRDAGGGSHASTSSRSRKWRRVIGVPSLAGVMAALVGVLGILAFVGVWLRQ